jgi:hypothetical protein
MKNVSLPINCPIFLCLKDKSSFNAIKYDVNYEVMHRSIIYFAQRNRESHKSVVRRKIQREVMCLPLGENIGEHKI